MSIRRTCIITSRCLKTAFFGLLIGWFLTGPSHANTWRTFGYGPRAVAMGGAFCSVADDYSAGYYNPAGLLLQPGTKFGFGFQYVKQNLEANGAEVEMSRDSNALFLGGSMILPFHDELENRIAVGYYFYQPLFYSLDLLVPETTLPQFPVLESMSRMQIIHLAMAFDIIPGILIGGGISVSSDLGGVLDLQPGVGGFGGVEEIVSSVDQEVHPILSGTAGLIIRPGTFLPKLKPLTIGFTWRDEHFLDLDIPVSVVLSGFILALDLTSAFLYTPTQWVGGISYQVTPDLLFSCDVSYNEWSGYRVPSLTIATAIDIPLIVLKEGINEPPRFKDTVTPRLGVEFRPYRGGMLDGFLRAGYFFEPSPVPEQTGRTNYLDSDRHVFSWGIGLLFKRILGKDLTRHPVSFDIGVAYHRLQDRRNSKEPLARTDNPGFPEIKASGDIWHFTCGISYGSRPGGNPEGSGP